MYSATIYTFTGKKRLVDQVTRSMSLGAWSSPPQHFHGRLSWPLVVTPRQRTAEALCGCFLDLLTVHYGSCFSRYNSSITMILKIYSGRRDHTSIHSQTFGWLCPWHAPQLNCNISQNPHSFVVKILTRLTDSVDLDIYPWLLKTRIHRTRYLIEAAVKRLNMYLPTATIHDPFRRSYRGKELPNIFLTLELFCFSYRRVFTSTTPAITLDTPLCFAMVGFSYIDIKNLSSRTHSVGMKPHYDLHVSTWLGRTPNCISNRGSTFGHSRDPNWISSALRASKSGAMLWPKLSTSPDES